MLFKATNLLTGTTDLGLLHLFHHLRDVAFDDVQLGFVRKSNERRTDVTQPGIPLRDTFRSTVFKALFQAVGAYRGKIGGNGKPMRFHCHNLAGDYADPTAKHMWEYSGLFHFHTLCGIGRPPDGCELELALAELTRVRDKAHRHISGAWFNSDRINRPSDSLASNGIDQVVSYFQNRAPSLEHCPKRIIFHVGHFIGRSNPWPITCPRDTGVWVPCRDHSPKCPCGILEFRLHNQPTGREFRVHFRPDWMYAAEGPASIYNIYLLFN